MSDEQQYKRGDKVYVLHDLEVRAPTGFVGHVVEWSSRDYMYIVKMEYLDTNSTGNYSGHLYRTNELIPFAAFQEALHARKLLKDVADDRAS
jgi:hypothetical protein